MRASNPAAAINRAEFTRTEEPTQAELKQRQLRAEFVSFFDAQRVAKIIVWNYLGKCYDTIRFLILTTIVLATVYVLFAYPYLKLRTYNAVPSYYYGILFLVQIFIVQYVYDLGQEVIEDREFQIPPTPSPSPAPADI